MTRFRSTHFRGPIITFDDAYYKKVHSKRELPPTVQSITPIVSLTHLKSFSHPSFRLHCHLSLSSHLSLVSQASLLQITPSQQP